MKTEPVLKAWEVILWLISIPIVVIATVLITDLFLIPTGLVR